MKKLLILLAIGIVTLTLTGCGKKEPVKIELTKDNFENYIILDVQLTDFEEESKQGLFTSYEYRGAANLVAKARLKKDVEIEDVVIEGKIMTSGLTWALNTYDFTLKLDKNGEADFSKKITSGNYGLTAPQEPSISSYFDYELKDGEFFLENNTILITSISGNVYDTVD